MDFGMQNDELKQKANIFIDYVNKYFNNNRVNNFGLKEKDEEEDTYIITFKAYDFFYIYCDFKCDSIICRIGSGNGYITLLNTKELNTTDYYEIIKKLEKEIELRIPDKFLTARGWL